MAAACVDWDVGACADWGGAACADVDAELVHAASETIARQSETAIATDLPAVPARGLAAPSPASVNAAFVVALTAILPGPANAPVSGYGLAAAVRGPGGGQREQCIGGTR